MQLADLFFSVRTEGTQQAHDQIGKLGKLFDSVGQGLSKVGSGIVSFGQTLTNKITLPLIDAAIEGVKYNATLQELESSFSVLLGSGDKAADMVQRLKKMGAETPFEITGLAESTKMLLSYGYTQEEVIPLMRMIGDVSLGNKLKFKDLGIIMGQISSLGKLQMGDLKQLRERGWDPMQQIIEKTGEKSSEFYERMRKGKVTYKEVEDALRKVTGEGERFYKGMEKGSQTLQGRLSTLKDNFMELLSNAMKPVFDFVQNIAVPALLDLIERFNGLSQPIKTAIVILTGLVGFLPIVITAFGGLVVAVSAVVSGIGSLALLISTIGLPILIAIGGAITTLTMLFVAFVAPIALVAGGLAALAIKTGAVSWVFEKVKTLINAIIQIVTGNMVGAMDLLVNKFGMSQAQAETFARKIQLAKYWVGKLIEVVQNVSQLLGAIFTADKQKMINILIEKFGISKKQAQEFAKKVLDLKNKVKELADKFINTASGALPKIINKLIEFAKWIYNNRDKIVALISKIIDFINKLMQLARWVQNNSDKIKSFAKFCINLGKTMVTLASIAIKQFGIIKKTITAAMNVAKMTIDGAKNALNALARIAGSTAKALLSIKLPNLPGLGALKSLVGHASGIMNSPIGHYALVGEKGPELMYVPKGASIYSNQQTRQMASNTRGAEAIGAGSMYNIDKIIIDAKNVKEFNDVVKIMENMKVEYNTRKY
jgi:hypothetical protein